MIELADAAIPAAAVASEAGPYGLTAIAAYLLRGVPLLIKRATLFFTKALATLHKLDRALDLLIAFLSKEVGEKPRESDEIEVYRKVNDGATDEEIAAVLEEMNPGDTFKNNIRVNGDRLLRIAREVTKRQREASGPRRAAQ